jgi:2-polyprenyl-6-methoxyphenol hydroxylase-like FAD-dependent oxidoreductase
MGEKLNILIIGGSAAGPTAAANARRRAPAANITLLEQGAFVSVGA